MPSSASTGTPEKFLTRVSSITSATVAEVEMQIGSTITPLSYFLTRLTSDACASGLMLRCTTPIPPAWARHIAARDSVTVSIAAETSGILSAIFWEKDVERSTSCGRTSDNPGTSKTSSKVRARFGCSIEGLYSLTVNR